MAVETGNTVGDRASTIRSMEVDTVVATCHMNLTYNRAVSAPRDVRTSLVMAPLPDVVSQLSSNVSSPSSTVIEAGFTGAPPDPTPRPRRLQCTELLEDRLQSATFVRTSSGRRHGKKRFVTTT